MTEQLIGVDWLNALPFRYAGNIGPAEISDAVRDNLHRIGSAIGHGCGLLGLFGVDFILADGRPWLVEVNPRYTASIEVFELATGRPFLSEHAAAFDGSIVVSPGAVLPGRMVGKGILYASHDLVVPNLDALDKSIRIADVPHAGEVIQKGWPVSDDSCRGGFAARLYKHAELAGEVRLAIPGDHRNAKEWRWSKSTELESHGAAWRQTIPSPLCGEGQGGGRALAESKTRIPFPRASPPTPPSPRKAGEEGKLCEEISGLLFGVGSHNPNLAKRLRLFEVDLQHLHEFQHGQEDTNESGAAKRWLEQCAKCDPSARLNARPHKVEIGRLRSFVDHQVQRLKAWVSRINRPKAVDEVPNFDAAKPGGGCAFLIVGRRTRHVELPLLRELFQMAGRVLRLAVFDQLTDQLPPRIFLLRRGSSSVCGRSSLLLISINVANMTMKSPAHSTSIVSMA